MRIQEPKGGIIINTASMAGFIPGIDIPVYTAAKHGVIGFTRSLSRRLVKTMNVRVVGIAPSFAPTPMVTNNAGSSKELQKMIQLTPMVDVELVIDAFFIAIEDNSLAGDIITVTKERGITILDARKPFKL